MRFEHRFIEGAPQRLEPGVLYVSIRHKSVLHVCACGCGHEVVTPLAPHRWQLIFDGETVSLEPSIGNSVLPCRSHYFITNNTVDWHRPMSDQGVERARRRDQRAVDAAFAQVDNTLAELAEATGASTGANELLEGASTNARAVDAAEAPLTTHSADTARGFWPWLRRRLPR